MNAIQYAVVLFLLVTTLSASPGAREAAAQGAETRQAAGGKSSPVTLHPVWQRNFPIPGRARMISIVALPDGGFLMGGGYLLGRRQARPWLFRLDKSGSRLWEGDFGEINTMALSISPQAGGDVLLMGMGQPSRARKVDAWAARVDRSGKMFWQRSYGTKETDIAFSGVSVTGGGFILAGGTEARIPGKTDAWVLRLDKQGNTLWEHTYGGDRNEGFFNVAQIPGGGFLLAGSHENEETGQERAWLIRLDAGGRKMWERSFLQGERTIAYGVSVLPGGGFLLTGSATPRDIRKIAAWVARLDSNGHLLWGRVLNEHPRGYAFSSHPAPEGGVFVLAVHHASGVAPFGGGEGWVIRLDSSGKTLWEQSFTPGKEGRVVSIAVRPGGGFIAAGVIMDGKKRRSTAFAMAVEIRRNRQIPRNPPRR